MDKTCLTPSTRSLLSVGPDYSLSVDLHQRRFRGIQKRRTGLLRWVKLFTGVQLGQALLDELLGERLQVGNAIHPHSGKCFH